MNKKEKKVIGIMNLILLGIILIGLYDSLYKYNGLENIELSNIQYKACKEYINSNENEKVNIKKLYPQVSLNDEICTSLSTHKTSTSNAFAIYFDTILGSTLCSLFFPFFTPMLILLPTIYIISKKMNSKEIKNYLLREKYEKYIKRLIKIGYINIFGIPIMLVLLFIFCIFITGNIDPEAAIASSQLSSNIGKLYNNGLFYISYIVIIILNLAMYTNIALIVLSQNKNFIISFIESYLMIYVVWFISEVFIGMFFQKNLGIPSHYFNLLSIYNWSYINNISLYFFINMCGYLITFIIMCLCYKNKEKIIMVCER